MERVSSCSIVGFSTTHRAVQGPAPSCPTRRQQRHDPQQPGGVVVDGVLDLQRIVVDLLLGDVAGVVHQVQVVVVINDLVVHQVVDNGVGCRVTCGAVGVV